MLRIDVSSTEPVYSDSFEMLEDVNFGTRGFGEDEAGEIYHIFNNDIYKFELN